MSLTASCQKLTTSCSQNPVSNWNLVDALSGSVRSEGMWIGVANLLKRASGGIGIFSHIQMPIGQAVQRTAILVFRGLGMLSDFTDRPFSTRDVVELGGIKFSQHHPAIVIIFFAFELSEDFLFG